MAIGIGHGTDLLKPLAVAVMGGLLLSVFMSLWLAPVLYAAWPVRRPLSDQDQRTSFLA
ncbi:MAG: efflux RND transporter permease subunit [Acidithiobacillus sp.]